MKKFKFLVGAVALFALVVANVWNAATTLRGSELSVADVEAMANPEGIGSDSPSFKPRWFTCDIRHEWFTMSGQGIDYAAQVENRIITFYRVWDCVRTSNGNNECVAGDHREYPMRITEWGGVQGPEEGNTPYSNNWDGYVLPY